MAKFQTKAFTGKKPIALPDNAQPQWVPVDLEFPATAPALNDLLEACELPDRYRVVDWTIVWPDVDSNGAPTVAASLGVENAGGTDLGAEVWGTGLQGGRTGGIDRATTSASAQGDTTVSRKIALKFTTAFATYAGAGKIGQLLLLVQG